MHTNTHKHAHMHITPNPYSSVVRKTESRKDKQEDSLKVWQINKVADDRQPDSDSLTILWNSQKWLVCTLSEQEIILE